MSKEVFRCYDSADYLKTDADITAYLEAATEESNDPAYLARARGVVARARHMNQFARAKRTIRKGLNAVFRKIKH